MMERIAVEAQARADVDAALSGTSLLIVVF